MDMRNRLTRTGWALLLVGLLGGAVVAGEAEVVSLGTRRELFVDDLLLGQMQGVRLKLHEPTRLPRDVYPPRPTGHYATVIRDGDLYRLYYRGDKIPGAHWRDGWARYHGQEVTLYAESRDGYRWTTPDLKLYEIEQFPAGNVVLDKGLRSIARATSKDFLQWSDPVIMEANQAGEHLYTSGTHPYFRAPHIYIALATRFMANRSSITDIVFLAARPGARRYTRLFPDAFIRPGLGQDGWGNRSNYIAWHIVPTSETQMSIYNVNGDHLVLRTDGFISVHAGAEEGEFLTKPFTFGGDRLEINESTSAAGRIRVEIQEPDGRPIAGYTLEQCVAIYGDRIRHIVEWADGQEKRSDVSALRGRPVRLRFALQEADLYSFCFPATRP